MADLCHHCHKRPIAKGRRKYCGEECALAEKDEALKRSNATAIAKEKARRAANPSLSPCRCGCGKMVRHPYKWTVECRIANAEMIEKGIRDREKVRRRAETVKRRAERAADRARMAQEQTLAPEPDLTLSNLIQEANELRKRREGLNPEMLAARLRHGR